MTTITTALQTHPRQEKLGDSAQGAWPIRHIYIWTRYRVPTRDIYINSRPPTMGVPILDTLVFVEAARGAGGADTAVEEQHLAAHLAGGGADQEDNAVRHLPGLGEAAEGGAVDHGVSLGGLSARAEGERGSGMSGATTVNQN